MLEFVHGNLLDTEADALVNTVNTKGVMGKGVALQFKRAFPENYKAYRAACDAGEVQLGRMFVHQPLAFDGPRAIINFPTKGHWKSRSQLDDVATGLADLRRVLLDLEVRSVAVPALGCGLGGLDWQDVRPLIVEALADLDLHVMVFEPQAAPAPEAMRDRTDRPRLTAFRATLIGLLEQYLGPGEAASPLEVQKLLYFQQEAGEALSLRFVKEQFGPYADAARHAVQHLEGHYLTGYGDGTGDTSVRLLPGASSEARAVLAGQPDTLERYERVAALITGFETPYGLELLATTHWVGTQEDAGDAEAAVERIAQWSHRKGRLFTAEHVGIAWQRLDGGGWLTRARLPVGA